MKKFTCNLFLVSLLNQTRFVTFDVHFIALNKLHELGLPNSALLSLAWVTWPVIMILPYFFVTLTKTLFYFLGLEITRSIDGLYITQAKYTSELLSRAGLTDSKTVDILVELNAHLTPTEGKPLSNPFLYKMLGWQPSLSYCHSSKHFL